MMETGKVWLIGAGPGDAGLLTQKAVWALQQADVIIYDALVSLEILGLLPAKARKIYVGKRAARHTMRQEEINQLLLQEAQAGNRVARLKGGDPFVFGRGAEELVLLVQHGIPFEVVPGVTSAVAAAAYAGIPVTHRDVSSSFHVVTGHTKKGAEERIDYEALVQMKATLVFLMGVGNAQSICQKLMQAGMAEDTPAAIVQDGTTYKQKQLLSTVAQLPEQIVKQEFSSPAIIVVGQAAGYMNEFHWRDKLSLFGKQCIVTRPREQAQAFCQRLKEEGAQVITLPSIETQVCRQNQTDFNAKLQDMARNYFEENWIVLSSQADVRYFFSMLASSPLDIRELGGRTRWAVVGERTAQTLREYGIRADYVPDTYYVESLAAGLQKKISASAKVFVFKGNLGSNKVAQRMLECGVPCEELVIYQTAEAEQVDAALQREVREAMQEPHTFVTFTSASCVEGFVGLFDAAQDFSAVRAVCIGEKTAAKASAYGMQVYTARQQTTESMIECLQRLGGLEA